MFSDVTVKRTPTRMSYLRHERLQVRSLLRAHVIVAFLGAVDRDAAVGHADFLQLLRFLFRDENAVRGEGDADAFLRGVVRELEDVRPDQRLTARHQQRRHLELGEIVDHRLRFLGRHLAGERFLLRRGVAVDAFEVAGLRGVPDDDRTHAGRGSVLLLGRALVVPEPVAEESRAAQKFRHADHFVLPPNRAITPSCEHTYRRFGTEGRG
jgi:hypothetical protein